MSTMHQIYLIMILFFTIPIVIYLICSKLLKRPFLNIIIFTLLLLSLMIWQIFGYDIKYGNEINFLEDIRSFFHNDSVIIVWVEWIPAIIGAFFANIIGIIIRRNKK